MNYRHGFHAGNFADLAKHAALMALLRALREAPPLLVVDTHAGAGAYDLADADFARSKEAEAGVKHLLSATVPESLKPLADYVRARNASAGFRDRIGLYPGSPMLALDHLRAGDGYVGCELREDDFARLRQRVGSRGRVSRVDGYEVAVDAAADGRDLLYLIDPPFEWPDDYARIVACLRDILALRPEARALVWLPLKDLETFDAFLRRMEDEIPVAGIVVVEVRLRPLWNPMKMNGCVLVAVNPPHGLREQLQTIAGDVAAVFGEPGAMAKVYSL